jgi:hypothetical protein
MVERFGSLLPSHYLGPSEVQAKRELEQAQLQFARAEKRLARARRRHEQAKKLPDGQVAVFDVYQEENGG